LSFFFGAHGECAHGATVGQRGAHCNIRRKRPPQSCQNACSPRPTH
jgi:hypothetical protein